MADKRTSLVPQSTSLRTIRVFMEALARGEQAITEIGFAPRRIHYARNACESLGLVDGDMAITPLGREFLAEVHGSFAEAMVLKKAIIRSPVLRVIAPNPFSRSMSREEVSQSIQNTYGLAENTANDRASTVVAWVTQVKAALAPDESESGRESVDSAESRAENVRRPRRGTAAGRRPAAGRGTSTGSGATAGRRAATGAANTGAKTGGKASSSAVASGGRLASIPVLVLPKRFERLRAQSEKADIDPMTVVQKVETAAKRIDFLLRRVTDGKTGQFEVFFGDSGSGKTTFLFSLPKFFRDIEVFAVRQNDGPLDAFAARVERDHTFNRRKLRVYFFEDRENERLSDDDAERFFESLRVLFRKDEGQVVVIWPVTKPETRDQLARIAWGVGADSVVPVDTRGVYKFEGVPREKYFEVADLTARSLNGESLEVYGVSRESGERLAAESTTIGSYFSRLETYASERQGKVWSILRERVRPRLWVVLPGDIGDMLDSTVARLTQGRKYRIDVERLLEFLDDASNESNYLQDWRRRRMDAAFLFRILDVRLVPLHPGAALAAIRGFGADSLRRRLNKGSVSKSEAIGGVERSVLYKLILEELGGNPDPYTKGRPPSKETEHEYNRVQSVAKSGDKALNHALADALRSTLEHEGVSAVFRAERRSLGDTNLQPDVQIEMGDAEVLCLEPTWRTSGQGVKGELKPSQNSMTPGVIQKYILEKVMEYVKALDI